MTLFATDFGRESSSRSSWYQRDRAAWPSSIPGDVQVTCDTSAKVGPQILTRKCNYHQCKYHSRFPGEAAPAVEIASGPNLNGSGITHSCTTNIRSRGENDESLETAAAGRTDISAKLRRLIAI